MKIPGQLSMQINIDVSIPRVHQLKAQALAKLKEAMGGVAEVI